jgi:large subunit ribosomal protein L21
VTEAPTSAEEAATEPEAAPAEATAPPPAPKGYAIIETGGKQYRVSVGDRISVERLAVEDGKEITIDRVLLVGGDGTTRVGTPVVAGATVTAMVDDHFRGEKIVVFKYKPKKRYRRRTGHRQSLSHLTITAINA